MLVDERRDGGIAHRIMALAIKSDDLSLIMGTLMQEKRTDSFKFYTDTRKRERERQ